MGSHPSVWLVNDLLDAPGLFLFLAYNHIQSSPLLSEQQHFSEQQHIMADTRRALVTKDTPTKKKETHAERVKRRRPFKPPHGRSPFLEMPAELRVMVLSHLLTRGESFELRGYMRVKDKRINLSIFRANKQLYSEANAVWYGTNTFKLNFPHTESIMGISNFIEKVGESCKYLRHIEISYATTDMFTEREDFEEFGVECLRALQSCLYLQSVKLPHAMACFGCRDLPILPNCKTYEQVKAAFGLFKSLQKVNRSEKNRKPLSQLIKVMPPESYCKSCVREHNSGCARKKKFMECTVVCASMKEHCNELTSKIYNFLSMDRRAVLRELRDRIKARKLQQIQRKLG